MTLTPHDSIDIIERIIKNIKNENIFIEFECNF